MDCDTLQHLADATSQSTKNNIPQLFTWQWRNWDVFINSLFKAIPGIRKYHHFKVSCDYPGIVFVREKFDSPETQISILNVV